ncbi:MAG: hypothetical protein WAL50_18895 [Kineosporiaceae bacterium]
MLGLVCCLLGQCRLNGVVTNLHEAGMPLEVISRVTGLAGEVTCAHYLNIAAERTRGEFGALADRFGSQWADRAASSDDRAPTGETPTEPHSAGGEV